MKMILPDLAHKSRIILVENVTNEFAQKYSGFYPNVVFFTNEQEIWKNGICYSQPITVDENQNKIQVNDITYELLLENNVLKFNTKEYLYWGVFGDNGENVNDVPDINKFNVKGINEDGFGWRVITDESAIIDCKIDFFIDAQGKIINPFYKHADINNNPEYAKYFIGPIYDIRDNKFNTIKFHKNVNTIHLFLPKKLVEYYHVGIYDDLDGSELFTDAQGTKDFNVSSNFEKMFDKTEDASKFEIYNHYEIKTSGNFNAFNLRIYSKDKNLN